MRLNSVVSFMLVSATLLGAGCSNTAQDAADVTTADSNATNTADGAESAAGGTAEQDAAPTNAKSRRFELNYGATLTGLPEGADVRIWIPVPTTSADQTVEALGTDFPGEVTESTDSVYGNQMKYCQFKAADGRIQFSTKYRIERNEVRGLDREAGDAVLKASDKKQFLAANSKVPLAGKQLDLLKGFSFSDDPVEIARSLYDRVDQHVKYDKSKPGYGNGDVLWVCDSRTGNCTDFHSLFISWARAKGIPARFEIGFPLPPERGEGKIGGYHCWAMFHAKNKGWVPVDISEADKHPEMKEYYFGNLTENRVAFSMGRDIVLNPKQAGEPLNYFVYPYIEVDGKPLGKEQIQLEFSYRDVK